MIGNYQLGQDSTGHCPAPRCRAARPAPHVPSRVTPRRPVPLCAATGIRGYDCLRLEAMQLKCSREGAALSHSIGIRCTALRESEGSVQPHPPDPLATPVLPDASRPIASSESTRYHTFIRR